MSKTELVEFVAATAGLTKADALRAIDATVEVLTFLWYSLIRKKKNPEEIA